MGESAGRSERTGHFHGGAGPGPQAPPTTQERVRRPEGADSRPALASGVVCHRDDSLPQSDLVFLGSQIRGGGLEDVGGFLRVISLF